MEIITIPYGPLSSNMYIVREGDSYIVIDPSVSPSEPSVKEACDGSSPEAIIITHGHFDHMAEADEWQAKYPTVPIYMAHEDFMSCSDGLINGSALFFKPRKMAFTPRDISLIDNSTILGAHHCSIIRTPGHTPGQVCIVIDDNMFSGDMLFEGGIGRCDLPGGDSNHMYESIKKLFALDKDYKVYPGHGDSTTLLREKQTNPFI